MTVIRFPRPLALCLVAGLLSACVQNSLEPAPAMRWDHRPEAAHWTKATLSALDTDGAVLATTVPADIDRFCPGYREASLEDRQAFWSGLFSALAKYESTWNPKASGGGGAWIGLLQIAPGTARAYSCGATSTSSLKDGAANLSCAVKIAARQVPRDNAIVSSGSGKPAGLARDWAPMRKKSKVAEMAAWTSAQSYCRKPSTQL